MKATKAKRGDAITTELAHELDLHEYPWPRLLGHDRAKWERVAALVDEAARDEHRRACSSHDGRRGYGPGRFEGDHAESHRHYIRMTLVALVDAGIPDFLVKL